MGLPHISYLRPNITKNWQLNVMISRAWTLYNPNNGQRMSFDVILSDECVSYSMCFYKQQHFTLISMCFYSQIILFCYYL